MKQKFSEYYSLNDVDIKQHWQEDIFCFDANVLLNLYRYTPKTRNAFLDLLEKIKGRVWLPYQVAFEYQKNRLVVINKQQEAYSEVKSILDSKKNELEGKLNEYLRHPYLQIEELKRQIQSAFDSIKRDINPLESKHPDYLQEDPIWLRLTEILEGRIGDDFTSEEFEKIYKEGKKRYDEEIPPGYKDKASKKSENNRSLYGDYIIWKQLLEYAKKITPSIIFITDDRQDDWWYKFKGRTLGPRPDLIKEFKDETRKRINIYQADRFLDFAAKNLNQSFIQDAVEEIRKVRMDDESKIVDLINVSSYDKPIAEGDGESSFEKAVRTTAEDNLKKDRNG